MGKKQKTGLMSGYELVTVTGSNLFGLDDYIKEYLESHPELPIDAQLKIILRELITYDISVQLKELMGHMGFVSFYKIRQ